MFTVVIPFCGSTNLPYIALEGVQRPPFGWYITHLPGLRPGISAARAHEPDRLTTVLLGFFQLFSFLPSEHQLRRYADKSAVGATPAIGTIKQDNGLAPAQFY